MTVEVEDVLVPSGGGFCAATLFRPTPTDRPLAAVLLGNGFANVRRMSLPDYATAFADAGYLALTIDYRHLGDSDGTPRQQVLPETQCDDLRNAITWLSGRPDVDPGRIALWGTSFAGGHVLRIAAVDRRVAAVIAQVPAIGLWRYLRRQDSATRERFLAAALADRLSYLATGETRPLAITAAADEESILGPTGLEWHRRNEERHPTFHNWIAAHSLDAIATYDPAAFIEDVSPTPLLMILVDNDATIPSDIARAAYDRPANPNSWSPCRAATTTSTTIR